MKSSEYKSNIRNIIRNTLHKDFPGLDRARINKMTLEIARAIHARFYGANVDDVASPIWRDDPNYDKMFSDAKATKTAKELLEVELPKNNKVVRTA